MSTEGKKVLVSSWQNFDLKLCKQSENNQMRSFQFFLKPEQGFGHAFLRYKVDAL